MGRWSLMYLDAWVKIVLMFKKDSHSFVLDLIAF